jgi:DNA-binding HxlR family transcriptional regulator/putative sterol carrier protein
MPSSTPPRTRRVRTRRESSLRVAADGLAEGGAVFDPVHRSLDLIGDRWTLVLVRHLLARPRGFQELRSRTGIAPRILSARLRQMVANRLVETVPAGGRSLYGLTDLGRTLEPAVREIALWWVRHIMRQAGPFKETTAASVVEALPFLLRDERTAGVRITYELRLTGKGGGVWVIDIDDGDCRVREGFAERADVRYTADARDWTLLAIGLMDDREAVAEGKLQKDGRGGSIAWYFHQPYSPKRKERGDPK